MCDHMERKTLFKCVGAAVAGVAISTGIGCRKNETIILPPGFSTETNDYKFKSILDMGWAHPIVFYSNEEPILEAEGGQNQYMAKDIYCPGLMNWESQEIGCRGFVEGDYKISSPKRIIVVPNPDYSGQ